MITKLLLVPKQFILGAALFWTAFIAYVCLIKSSGVPVVPIDNIDKIVHAFLHLVFTTLWFFYLKKQINSYSNSKLLVVSFISSFLYGISIEVMQELFTQTRKADFFDVLANVTGALLALTFIFYWNKKADKI